MKPWLPLQRAQRTGHTNSEWRDLQSARIGPSSRYGTRVTIKMRQCVTESRRCHKDGSASSNPQLNYPVSPPVNCLNVAIRVVTYHKRGKAMVVENRILICLALTLTLICTACGGLGLPGSTSATNKYDGTYDWISPTVNGQNTSCSACVFITNGQISSISSGEGGLSGTASDNITFTGPCPT